MGVFWYALFSKPRKEVQVKHYLTCNNITTFYPTLKIKPVNPRSAHVRGFFPRYLFVHVDLEEVGANVLKWIPGVVGLIEFGGEPAVVPDSFILALRKRLVQIEDSGGLNLVDLKHGDKVTVTAGSFAGYDAIFDAYLSGEQRVQLLLHWLGREVKVKVNANVVEKRHTR